MDSILYWNAVALEANRISHTRQPGEQMGPTLSSRALAIVHLAMYDAYAAIVSGTGPAYQAGLPAPPPSASGAAAANAAKAVAGAATTALAALYPSQRRFFEERLEAIGGGWDPFFEFGVDVANRLLAARRDDPNADDAGYGSANAPGRHRVDPDNPTQQFHAPFYGARSRLFAATQRFHLDPPPFKGTNGKFVKEYVDAERQVRGLGIAPELMGTLPSSIPGRDINQTVIGLFWGYDGAFGLGTPPRLYNQILRQLAETRSPGKPSTPNTEAQNARLFALANAAMADAGILAWDDKYQHDFWRPVVGIREHDSSMGPGAPDADHDISADTDTGWLPLGAPATNRLNAEFRTTTHGPYPCNQSVPGIVKNFTPNFPAYPSGHATFGAAALQVARLFYGVAKPDRRKPDQLFKGLDLVSEELNGVNQDNRGTVRPRHRRSFPDGLWQMLLENGESRLYLGVHWIFDAFAGTVAKPDLARNVGGVRLGLDIAENIFDQGLEQSAAAPPRIS